MTNEEAVEVLEGMKVKIAIPKAAELQRKRNGAIDMAIEALNNSEIPNSSDTVSRQAAIENVCEEVCKCFDVSPTEGYEVAENAINQLPSAEQEIKPISYEDCANAMMMMWMDEVITDGEYNRIMDRLNAQHKAEIWAKQKRKEAEHETD